jgi:hypothetical protein
MKKFVQILPAFSEARAVLVSGLRAPPSTAAMIDFESKYGRLHEGLRACLLEVDSGVLSVHFLNFSSAPKQTQLQGFAATRHLVIDGWLLLAGGSGTAFVVEQATGIVCGGDFTEDAMRKESQVACNLYTFLRGLAALRMHGYFKAERDTEHCGVWSDVAELCGSSRQGMELWRMIAMGTC